MHKPAKSGKNPFRIVLLILFPLLLVAAVLLAMFALKTNMLLMIPAGLFAVAALVTALLVLLGRGKKEKRVPGAVPDLSPRAGGEDYPATRAIHVRRSPIIVGKLHGIGARSYQQDCLAEMTIAGGEGRFAVVADGMGGLTDSGEVSQRVVEKCLELASGITSVTEGNPLIRILERVTDEINTMLGPDKIYKSGSTMVAAAIVGDRFQWISVGDSRLYLYREGYINALNRDHDQLQEWMPEILAGIRNYKECEAHPDGRKLSSFLGMGKLRYVDASIHSIRLYPGDRILLMSDGVYGTVPEKTITEVLNREKDVVHAAQDVGEAIVKAALPHQDNYSLVILGVQPRK